MLRHWPWAQLQGLPHHVRIMSMERVRDCEVFSCFAEYLPRVSTFRVAVASRESCKLSFTARRVCKTKVTHSAGPCEEEICNWPAHLPELDPSSCFDKLTPEGTLQLRFQSRGPDVAGSRTENLLDPPDLSEVPSHLVIRCGFCSLSITKPEQ